MGNEEIVYKTTAVGHSTAATSSFCEDFALSWDYKVLAITETHALVFLADKDKQEYVSYSHDNHGNCHSGFYTRNRGDAIDNFVKRMRIYL